MIKKEEEIKLASLAGQRKTRRKQKKNSGMSLPLVPREMIL